MIPNLWRVPVLNPPPHTAAQWVRCSTVQVQHQQLLGAGMPYSCTPCWNEPWSCWKLIYKCMYLIVCIYLYIYKVLLGEQLKLLVFGWCQDQTAAVLVGEVICWECHLSLRSGISPRPRLGHDSGDVSHGWQVQCQQCWIYPDYRACGKLIRKCNIQQSDSGFCVEDWVFLATIRDHLRIHMVRWLD